MKEYYLVIKYFDHPVNNWGYRISEVDRANHSEVVVLESRTCGRHSPDVAIEKGGEKLKEIVKVK